MGSLSVTRYSRVVEIVEGVLFATAGVILQQELLGHSSHPEFHLYFACTRDQWRRLRQKSRVPCYDGSQEISWWHSWTLSRLSHGWSCWRAYPVAELQTFFFLRSSVPFLVYLNGLGYSLCCLVVRYATMSPYASDGELNQEEEDSLGVDLLLSEDKARANAFLFRSWKPCWWKASSFSGTVITTESL